MYGGKRLGSKGHGLEIQVFVSSNLMCEEERNKLSQSYMGTVYSEPLLLLFFFFFPLNLSPYCGAFKAAMMFRD